jgi:DNA repair exonuclease SbcCD ATPase subunit
MTESKELRAKVDANVKKLSHLVDKANVQTGIGVVLTSLFGLTLLLAFLALWIGEEYGDRAPLAVDITFYAGLTSWLISTVVLTASLANIILGIKLRKETNALRDEIETLEKSEAEVRVKQDAIRRAAEEVERVQRQTEEHQRAAAEASNAREAQARAEVLEMGEKRLEEQRKLEEAERLNKAAQAARVAKAVQETRTERQGRDFDGRNKPGGSPTQGKGR